MKLLFSLKRIIFIFAVLSFFLLSGCDDTTESLGDSWLKIGGEGYSLSKLDINYDGASSVVGVYKYYVTITSANLDVGAGTGSGEYILLTLFSSSTPDLPSGVYEFSAGAPESGKFKCDEDAEIYTDFIFPTPTYILYDITGGTISVNIDGTMYSISGDVTTTGGAATFSYTGIETGY
ncbi:MAG: hypothetical protein CVV44_11210 [Spirochaetae bacterium HGW-Spirochaetae-1]|jgi:hypothetical protein|nr:MAG: hypothetical protein CVV44_11210 [Spirochaetae bacterium HGW-Spirochaetae-1]